MGTGIPVPATIPEGSKAFIICVPDDPFFYGVVMGALKQTTFKYYWNGTEEEKDAVTERMLRMYYEYQDQDGCMLCSQIIECINSDPDVREALVNWFVDAAANNTLIQQAIADTYNPLAPGSTMPPEVTAGALTGSNPTCDLDKLWGWIDKGIEGMNANNLDAFQITEDESNVFERIALVTGAIPGIGVLPVDEAITFVQGLFTDDLFEAYEANDTTEYRRVLKCAIFCLAQLPENGCKVSMDLMLEYFKGRLAYTGADTLDDIVSFLILGVWEGTQVNDAFYLIQLLWLKYGNRFFKIVGLMGVATMFQLGEPSDDWILLCEECPSPGSKTWPFQTVLEDWTITPDAGTWVEGEGIMSDGTEPYPNTVDINLNIDMPEGTVLTRLIVKCYSQYADGSATRAAYWQPGSVTQDFGATGNSGEYTVNVVPSVTVPTSLNIQVSNNVVPGINVIREVTIEYDGDEPTWG